MAVILFGVFIALLLLGVPVAFAICSAAATTMFAGFGDAKMMIVVQRMFASCDSFSLIAVPFFIFAGDLLAGGRLRVHVDSVFPFGEIARAHERLEGGGVRGKVVVAME